MKKLIILALLLAGSFVAQAQTNVSYRITIDGVNTSWSYDINGIVKDQNRIKGLIYAYNVYTNTLATNQVALSMGVWLKSQHVVLVDEYSTQRQIKDNAAAAIKLTSLLTVNSDQLSTADLAALLAIAAKFP